MQNMSHEEAPVNNRTRNEQAPLDWPEDLKQERIVTFPETFYFLRSNSFKSLLSSTKGYCILISLHPDQVEPAAPMEHERVSHYRKQIFPALKEGAVMFLAVMGRRERAWGGGGRAGKLLP